MRIWHKDLIPVLPRQQLLGQWRECCAIAKSIAEKGTPNHVLVNRVMEYPPNHFYWYSNLVCEEMIHRGYKLNADRYTRFVCSFDSVSKYYQCKTKNEDIFKDWHNDRYLRQCLYNLQEKFDAGAIPKDEWQQFTDRFPEYK